MNSRKQQVSVISKIIFKTGPVLSDTHTCMTSKYTSGKSKPFRIGLDCCCWNGMACNLEEDCPVWYGSSTGPLIALVHGKLLFVRSIWGLSSSNSSSRYACLCMHCTSVGCVSCLCCHLCSAFQCHIMPLSTRLLTMPGSYHVYCLLFFCTTNMVKEDRRTRITGRSGGYLLKCSLHAGSLEHYRGRPPRFSLLQVSHFTDTVFL